MVKYYPLNLALKNKKCLVIGAGAVALRKVRRLMECGGKVCVIGPKAASGLRHLAKKKKIIFRNRRFILKDLKGAYLVISATDDRKLNSVVSSYCRKKGILINVVDSPAECNFILPSVVRRGALNISISTDGISPALAKRIRQELARKFGVEYAKLLRILKEIRPLALKKIKQSKSRRAFFKKALQRPIFNLIKKNKEKLAKTILKRILKKSKS